MRLHERRLTDIVHRRPSGWGRGQTATGSRRRAPPTTRSGTRCSPTRTPRRSRPEATRSPGWRASSPWWRSHWRTPRHPSDPNAKRGIAGAAALLDAEEVEEHEHVLQAQGVRRPRQHVVDGSEMGGTQQDAVQRADRGPLSERARARQPGHVPGGGPGPARAVHTT